MPRAATSRVLETVQKQLAAAMVPTIGGVLASADREEARVGEVDAILDVYGNRWHLKGGRLTVLAAQANGVEMQPQAVALPPVLECEARTMIATDDNGFIWAGLRRSRHLFRLNPRGPGYTGRGAPDLLRAQQRYHPTTSAHTFWQRYEPPPDVTLEMLAPSISGMCAIGTFSDGVQYELSIAADGVSLASPVQPAPEGLHWRAISARLECGNHDITAAEAGGRVFISGGAMHYRGFPATHFEFDSVWSLGPGDLERPSGWRVETHFPPAPPQQVSPREYNGLCTVGRELWVVGGSISASQPAVSRPDDRLPMTSVMAYNTVSKEWRTLPPMVRARDACVAEYVDGRVWAMCGVNVDTIESIAPSQEDSWQEEVDLQLPAGWDYYNVSCVLHEKIYLFGNGGLLGFTPATRQWDETLPSPPVRLPSLSLTPQACDYWRTFAVEPMSCELSVLRRAVDRAVHLPSYGHASWSHLGDGWHRHKRKESH
eukprot:COSAG02_NODE_5266_length_4485_cov_2.297538_2_plen_486_part_00